MRILFGVSHPKHVYIFKNAIYNLIQKGHEVKIIAVDKEITAYLLRSFNLPYVTIGKNQPTLHRKLLDLPKWEYLTYKIAKEFKPDIFVGRALPHLAHVSAILNKPFIIFEDTEVARTLHKITLPFADAIVTPKCYNDNLGKKHIRFNGYFELGYLHPNYFKPDPCVLEEIGLKRTDKFVIVRFVAWRAHHDIRDSGFSNKEELIRILEKKCNVLISSEIKLPKQLEKFKISISPEKMHNLMYYSSMFIGESATMATECALLGKPGILVSTSRRGYTDELETIYGMVYTFSNQKNSQKKALDKALELLEDSETQTKWGKKKEILIREKIDVTNFITNFIENFPHSFKANKNN